MNSKILIIGSNGMLGKDIVDRWSFKRKLSL